MRLVAAATPGPAGAPAKLEIGRRPEPSTARLAARAGLRRPRRLVSRLAPRSAAAGEPAGHLGETRAFSLAVKGAPLRFLSQSSLAVAGAHRGLHFPGQQPAAGRRSIALRAGVPPPLRRAIEESCRQSQFRNPVAARNHARAGTDAPLAVLASVQRERAQSSDARNGCSLAPADGLAVRVHDLRDPLSSERDGTAC